MRIIKERITHIPGAENAVWSTNFKHIVEAVIEAQDGQDLQSEFISKFVKEFEDVRYHTFGEIAYVFFFFFSFFFAVKYFFPSMV